MVECLKNSFVFVLNKFPLIFLFEKKNKLNLLEMCLIKVEEMTFYLNRTDQI